jgi:tetratricopeptide (TPR) repeat protein
VDALAWAGLATGYVNIGHSPTSTPEAFQRAKAAATRALKLDETIAEAHVALADVKLYNEWDWTGAEQAFQNAIELNPNLAEAHRHYAWLLLALGREDEATAALKRATAASPLAPVYTAELGWLYWIIGRYDEAIENARQSLELHPDYPVGLLVLGGTQAERGRFEEAIGTLERAGSFKWIRSELARTYARMGKVDDAHRILAAFDNADPASAPLRARIHAVLGEMDRALRGLEAGYASRNRNMPWIGVAPAFKSLRGEPRFQALLEKMELDG